MEEQISKVCLGLKKETEAVVDYTNLINQTEKEEHKRVFEVIRLDALDHIQHLTLELTKIIVSSDNSTEEEEE